ncbi:hypothetical protein PSTG_10866 [Puccinia striiformis f. sp. tritici PST-78]|uniref:HAT C-terminal dimerisation domain-containing protein n=1 Tax=Puccinia striiformis f. sp. tritici PST-78 TaxID=1165861 RepID=A0A0L0V9D8_9BASI|nr:hypothetical protein PSTG_10866 [Puccinia striiformis f. sp. tritici PST-78]
MQLTSIVRCLDAIIEWQKDKGHGPARQYCITSNDLNLAKDLIQDKYFKLAKWQPDWIKEAIRLAREMWETHCKTSPQPAATRDANARPKPAPTSVLAGLSGASEARAGQVMMDPLNVWLAGPLHLDEEGLPVNLLKWWIKEGCSGNTYGGLLQMALDVLSCPGEFCYFFSTPTTVDVERLFSFGRDYVSNPRH